MNLNFLKARDVDAGTLFELVKAVYASAPYFSDRFEKKYPTAETLRELARTLSSSAGSHFEVLASDEKQIGYYQIERRPERNLAHTAFLNMGLHPDYQGMGIGKQILEHAFARLDAEPLVEILYLMVRSDNLPAIRLYEKTGFERIATLAHDTKTPDGKYYDGILMRRWTGNFRG